MNQFLWGAATSGHQIEGLNIHSDWWAWEHKGNIEGGVTSGLATRHREFYKSDLKLAQSLGLNSYRFSIEWSRIEPVEGQWDRQELEWYRSLIGECEDLGLLPMMTLHHFTSPKWFTDQGGFTAPNSSKSFLKFVDFVVGELGSRIPLWCTLNEPLVMTVGGYLGKFMPPGVYAPDLAAKMSHNLLKSHVGAYDLIHSKVSKREGPWADHPLMVGMAHNMICWQPDRIYNLIEQVLARVFDSFYNGAWLDALVGKRQHFGVPGLLKKPPQVKEALGRKTVDFMGVNYYTKGYVQWRPRSTEHERVDALPVGVRFAKPGERRSDLDWSVFPEGFRRVLKDASRYGLPIYITENGIADRGDTLRPSYLKEHLAVVKSLKSEGVDIRGYYHWSLIDNFEWVKGFGPRFGLFRMNYETFERAETSSASLYRELIKQDRLNQNGR